MIQNTHNDLSHVLLFNVYHTVCCGTGAVC